MDGWVYMQHEETGGGNLFPDKPDVIAFQKTRGWEVADTPDELDPDAPNTGVGVHKPEQPAATPSKKTKSADSKAGQSPQGDEK